MQELCPILYNPGKSTEGDPYTNPISFLFADRSLFYINRLSAFNRTFQDRSMSRFNSALHQFIQKASFCAKLFLVTIVFIIGLTFFGAIGCLWHALNSSYRLFNVIVFENDDDLAKYKFHFLTGLMDLVVFGVFGSMVYSPVFYYRITAMRRF